MELRRSLLGASVDVTEARKAASESIKAVCRRLGHGTLDITLRV
jgi:hypothetical protein